MLIRLAVAWLSGIVLAARLAPPPGIVMVALALSGAGRVVARGRDPRAREAFNLGICLILGAARYTATRPDLGPDHIASRNGRGVSTFVGRIVAEPDQRDRRTDYRIETIRMAPQGDLEREGSDIATAAEPGRPWPDAAAAIDGATGGMDSAVSWPAARGVVLVQAPPFPPHAYGETVLVTGKVEAPPVLKSFDYRAYLAHQGIHSVMRRPRLRTIETGGHGVRHALIAVRERGRRALSAALPEPEAALVTGIVLGDARGIPARVDAAFRRTNTTHVIAISGSNIALLVTILASSVGRLLGRRRAVPVILVTLALYSALVGADAAVVRAAIMGGLAVVAGHLGRPGHAATGLMAAAWGMTAHAPDVVWDLGFQLSFAATAGLIAYASRLGEGVQAFLARRMAADRARAAFRLAGDGVLVTLAAQLTTWPIVAYHTGQVSLVGLAANFLIVPAQPAVMVLGGLTAATGMLSPAAGKLIGAVAWLPAAYTVRVVEAMARVPYAAVGVALPGWLCGMYLVVLGMVTWPRARRALSTAWRGAGRRLPKSVDHDPPSLPRLTDWALGPSRRRLSGVMPVLYGLGRGWPPVVALAVACALVWAGAMGRPDGLLHVYLLDVGQGDAILVVTPNGRRMLVDGGPSPSAVLDGLGRRLAPWDRRLDVVVLTHPDADHVGGLTAVLGRYEVGAIVDPELAAGTPDGAAWAAARARLPGAAARTVRASAGGRIALDTAAGVEARVLWPPEARLAGPGGGVPQTNENSVVLRLTYGAVRILLTGDIGAPAEAALLRAGADLRSDVLKVAHHGSGGSTTPVFLAAAAPRLALIGVGEGNGYGHPAPETLARLGGIPLYRTDRDGETEVISDGAGIWVR